MRILSGIQPTGTPHLGNYLGAIRNWVANQNEESLYCVVDLHSLTGEIDPAVLNANTRQLFAALLASGLDQNRCTLFIQSQVPWHSQLNWLLECVASYGELKRMTQFKEKAERQGAYRVGLLTYPVLMAADILLYQTTHVPVGDDQRQHLELARELAERFNHRYGDTFVVPEGMVPQFGARVMDLQEPTRKMSKSVSSPQGSIDLFDSESEITKKIKRAVTDTDNEVRYDWDHKPGLSNLLEIFGAVTYRTQRRSLPATNVMETSRQTLRKLSLLHSPPSGRATRNCSVIQLNFHVWQRSAQKRQSHWLQSRTKGLPQRWASWLNCRTQGVRMH